MKIPKSDINLKDTLLSGQCFRVSEEEDQSFTVILEDRVVNIKDENEYLKIKSNIRENLKEVVINFLDLDRHYEEINKYLIFKDESLREIIVYCKGYKILNQSDFEVIISFIISQNNSVRNIIKSIEKLSMAYGEKVTFNKKEYYLFPKLEAMINLTEEDFRNFGVGFRAKYLVDVINKIKEESRYIQKIGKLDTENALNKLMKVNGIGMKVASCILMFGYGRLDVFPIDTWVKKYYGSRNEKEIREKAYNKYDVYSGLAIQYMFHYERNKKKEILEKKF